MDRYQTEIVVPADRFIALQLPADLPEGRATVTVTVHPLDDSEGPVPEADAESEDIEWWEEFEDDHERVG